VQLKNDGDFRFFLADAAAIAVCIIFFYVASIEKYLFFFESRCYFAVPIWESRCLVPSANKGKEEQE
jgi:hypothetical protein